MPDLIQAHSLQRAIPKGSDAQLRDVAHELEATFLAEMLKHSGLGTSRESFGGGAGESQFSSLLLNEQAKAIVDAGGIGLAETIYESLKERTNV